GLIACGEDEAGGFDTGLPEDKPINQLTDDEAVQACRAFEAYVGDLVPADFSARAGCLGESTIAAVSEGTAACEQALADCLEASTTPPDEPSDFMCESASTAGLETCTATVGQIEECFTLLGEAFRLFESYTACDSLANADRRNAVAADLDAVADQGQALCGDLAMDGCSELDFGAFFAGIEALAGR
ncbi:MAG: hypothetical protein H5U40_14885, partial [Polyangiaceae bacterium]|nr:hypothetical protein [Polyangiaceae bacterium]